MNLEVLPTRTAGAAENMATDFLLLQRYPRVTPRFRHYGWHRPAFTFGYSQKFAFVQTQLPLGEHLDVCRRATGGGVVDHRDDWTFALVIPRGHPLEELRATQSYREVHEALAAALRAQDVPAITKPLATPPDVSAPPPADPTSEAPAAPSAAGPVGVCFQRAEVYDVINEDTGEKIAGAAQKRNKHGLLFQGSLWRPSVGPAMDWDQLYDDFVAGLATALGTPATPVPWPDFHEDELSALVDQYSSLEWNEFR